MPALTPHPCTFACLYLFLSVTDARVAQFINNERSFTFQLDTEDSGHYLLQAISKQEMVRWIEQINRVAKLAAKRRLTYFGNSPKPQLADHIHDHPSTTTALRDPRAGKGFLVFHFAVSDVFLVLESNSSSYSSVKLMERS